MGSGSKRDSSDVSYPGPIIRKTNPMTKDIKEEKWELRFRKKFVTKNTDWRETGFTRVFVKAPAMELKAFIKKEKEKSFNEEKKEITK